MPELAVDVAPGIQRLPCRPRVFTAHGCERIIRYAFDLAMTRRSAKVTSVTKSNAQQYGMTLWDEVFRRVAAEYPQVTTEQWLVDAMAARFVLKPETLDVVVGSQSLRRYPVRSWQRARGQSGHRGERQPRSRAPLPEHVRAGPRLSTGHCRPGHRQPDRRRSGAPP